MKGKAPLEFKEQVAVSIHHDSMNTFDKRDNIFGYNPKKEFYMVIYAGGKGDRFYKGVPKWLLPLANQRVIEWTIGMAETAPFVLGGKYANCCIALGPRTNDGSLQSAFRSELGFFIHDYNQSRIEHKLATRIKDEAGLFHPAPISLSHSTSKTSCIENLAKYFLSQMKADMPEHYKSTKQLSPGVDFARLENEERDFEWVVYKEPAEDKFSDLEAKPSYICALMGDAIYGLNSIDATLLDAQNKLESENDGALITILNTKTPKKTRAVSISPQTYLRPKNPIVKIKDEGLVVSISEKNKTMREAPAIFVFNIQALKDIKFPNGGLTNLCEALLEQGKRVHATKFDVGFYDFNKPNDYILAQKDHAKKNGGPICR